MMRKSQFFTSFKVKSNMSTAWTMARLGKVKYHAMVLVGMRRVDNKWRLLLQNCWYEMQFVEVSIEDFVSSGTKVVWVMHKQTKIPDMVPILRAVHAETFLEDGGGATDVRYQPM
jgi:CRISPR/Cas system endoribonuclease Cas6 (RAMP superfamily)